MQFPRQTVFDELGIAETILPFFLSSPTFQVGEDGSDTDWNMTVRLPEGLPEDFDYSEPVNIVTEEKVMMMMIMVKMMVMMTMIMVMTVSYTHLTLPTKRIV